MNENDKWGETVNGIIETLEKMGESGNEFNYFDPYLNESIKCLEKFVSEYAPKENIEIEEAEFQKNVEKIKMNYLKIGYFISKIFLENLFTEKEMRDFQGFIKKLCRFKDEIQDFTTYCDAMNPQNETSKIINKYQDRKTLNIIEAVKSRYLLLGFLLLRPKLLKEYI